jgi:HEAT repeat protein
MILAEWLKGLFRPHDVLIPEHLGVQELILLLKGGDPGIRRHAVKALGEMGDLRATKEVITMLNDGDDDVRLEAVVALGKIGDPMAVEPLIEKLESDDYFYVRKKAAYTLYVFYRQERLEEGLRQKILSHWRSWYLT